jgi:hypothetical protein
VRADFVVDVGDIDLRRRQPLQGLWYIAGPNAPCGTVSEFHHMAPIVLFDVHRPSPCDRIEPWMFRGAGLPAIRRDCPSDYSAEGRMRRQIFSRTSRSFVLHQTETKSRQDQFPADWAVVACRKDMSRNHQTKYPSIGTSSLRLGTNYSRISFRERVVVIIGVPPFPLLT